MRTIKRWDQITYALPAFAVGATLFCLFAATPEVGRLHPPESGYNVWKIMDMAGGFGYWHRAGALNALAKLEHFGFAGHAIIAMRVFLYPWSIVYFLSAGMSFLLLMEIMLPALNSRSVESFLKIYSIFIAMIFIACLPFAKTVGLAVNIGSFVFLFFFFVFLHKWKHNIDYSFFGKLCASSFAAGIFIFFPAFSISFDYAAYLFIGLVPFLILLLAGKLVNRFGNKRFKAAVKDAERFLCPACACRMVADPKALPWIVRKTGRLYAEERPMLYEDFRDYYICLRCGGDERFEGVKSVVAVIGRPRDDYIENMGDKVYVHVVESAKSTRFIYYMNALEIRNEPGLDYDFLVQHFYLHLTEDPAYLLLSDNPNKNLSVLKHVQVILKDDPPVSPNVKNLLNEWFRKRPTTQG